MSRRTDKMWQTAMRVTALTVKAAKPSPAQLKALRRMDAWDCDGTVYRLPGGFWVSGKPAMYSASACNTKDDVPAVPLEKECSDVWCDIRTVRAMEKNGWVERTGAFPEEWRDSRRITDAGRAIIAE